MALINCPECGKQISDKAISCIYCGYPLASELSKSDPTEKGGVSQSTDGQTNEKHRVREEKLNEIKEKLSTSLKEGPLFLVLVILGALLFIILIFYGAASTNPLVNGLTSVTLGCVLIAAEIITIKKGKGRPGSIITGFLAGIASLVLGGIILFTH